MEQLLPMPLRHHEHSPQGTSAPRATRSPSFTRRTFFPTATTVPEASWPMTAGGRTRGLPWRRIRTSDPQIATDSTFNRAESSSISGTSTSLSLRSFRSSNTAVNMVQLLHAPRTGDDSSRTGSDGAGASKTSRAWRSDARSASSRRQSL